MKLFIVMILAFLATSLSAAHFKPMGSKATSMGGTSVANSMSSTAAYNNPALLGKAKRDVEVSLGLSASVYDHGAGASYSYLDHTGVFDLMDDANEDVDDLDDSSIEILLKGLDVMLDMDGKGVEVGPEGYVGAQVHGYGFGVFITSNVTFVARVSQEHSELIYKNESSPTGYSEIMESGEIVDSSALAYGKTSLEAALDSGETRGDAFGLAVVEIPIAYGRKFETSQGNVYLGAALKLMQAVTYTEKVTFEDTDKEIEGGEGQDETSTSFGIDLGIAYEPKYVENLTLGLVAKNLNSPSFDVFDARDVEIEPMLRVGAAYDILDNVEVAMDIDLTSNETSIPGLESQMIGAGVNYVPVNYFNLRGGLMTNLDSADKAGMVFTTGFGLGVDVFEVDLSAQYSTEFQSVDGITYPQYGKVELAFISRW